MIQILLKRVNVQTGIYNYLGEFLTFNLNVTKKNKQAGVELRKAQAKIKVIIEVVVEAVIIFGVQLLLRLVGWLGDGWVVCKLESNTKKSI